MAAMVDDLRSLLYLDVRQLVNRIRLIQRDPRRLLPWVLVIGWIAFSRLLRVTPRGRTAFAGTALLLPALAVFLPGAYLTLLGLVVARATTRSPAAFRSPADARFLIGSRMGPRLVVGWLQVRRVLGLMVVSLFNVLLIVAFLPADGPTAASLPLLFVAIAGAYVALQAAPMAAFMLSRRLPAVPWGQLAVVAAAAGAASAVLALLGDFDITPAPPGVAAVLLHLPPGQWIRDGYDGQVLPVLLMLAFAAVAVGLTVHFSADCYPELWESSVRLFTLRRVARAQGGMLRRSDVRRAMGQLRSRPATSASDRWVPPGAAAILWKEWLTLCRAPAALLIQVSLTVGSFLAGAIVGLLLIAHEIRLASTIASLGGIAILLVNVYAGLRLGPELRSPVWWLSSGGLRERLLAWTIAGMLRQAVPACIGCATALLVVGDPPLALASLVALPAATWTLRMVALASYALMPSRTDLRGPGRMLRVLLFQATAVPPLIVLLVFTLLTRNAVIGALTASAVLIGEGWLLLELSAWLVSRNGLGYARAEAR